MIFNDSRYAKRWQTIGLIALAVVTLTVSMIALLQNRTPAQTATPAPTMRPPSASSAPTTSAPPTSSPSATPSAALSSASQASSSPLGAVADAIEAPGGSVMVFGDGTGNEDDEWVAVWAREHLGADRVVAYRLWDPGTGDWREPVAMGNGQQDLDVWNASTISPSLPDEPGRIRAAWQPVDAVLLSYGHLKDPAAIGGQLTGIVDAIRQQDPQVPIAVILQNPGPSNTAAGQEQIVRAVAEWANQQQIPTLDVYNRFPVDQAQRDAILEADGSPNEEGSRLFAQIVSDALTLD